MMKQAKQTGMTIVELLTVLAIIGLLAVMSYPSYQSYMLEVRRSDGHIALTKFAHAMERYYTINNQYYTGSTIADVYSSLESDEGFYNLSYAGGTVSYTVSAVPVFPQNADTDCGTLRINQLGQKSATGSLGNDACW